MHLIIFIQKRFYRKFSNSRCKTHFCLCASCVLCVFPANLNGMWTLLLTSCNLLAGFPKYYELLQWYFSTFFYSAYVLPGKQKKSVNDPLKCTMKQKIKPWRRNMELFEQGQLCHSTYVAYLTLKHNQNVFNCTFNWELGRTLTIIILKTS